MAKELILMAEPRTVLGKQVKALRRQGLIPGVVYGPAIQGSTVQVSVNRRELERFYTAYGHASLLSLKVGGDSHRVYIREVQVEPVRHTPLHVDFFAPNLKAEITASVPVILRNLDTRAAGVLSQTLDEIQVHGLPDDLPQQIEVDASGLHVVGDSLHVRDLSVPANVTVVTDGDLVVAILGGESRQDEDIEPAEAASEEASTAGEEDSTES